MWRLLTVHILDAMNFVRKFSWIITGGAACLIVVVLFIVSFRHEGGSPSLTSSPTVNPSPITISSRQNDDLVQIPAIPPKRAEGENEQLIPPAPPPLDKTAIAIHQKMAVSLKTEFQEQTRRLYGAAFQQLGLSADVQEKVIEILTQQQEQLEQQAFEAAQSGNVPTPPSLDAARSQQAQQNQQLRSVLGDTAYAQFNQYQATLPDRIVVESMNQQGANLSENQSQQLVQILTAARQQTIGQAGITQNLSSMSPDQAMTVLQQQQVLLQQAVGNRVQSLLTPEQAATLKGLLSQNNINR
jgi:hypothetical protein